MFVYKDCNSRAEVLSSGLPQPGCFFNTPNNKVIDTDKLSGCMFAIANTQYYDNETASIITKEQYDDMEDTSTVDIKKDLLDGNNLFQVEGLTKFKQWHKCTMKWASGAFKKMEKGPERKQFKKDMVELLDVSDTSNGFAAWVKESFSDLEFWTTDIADALQDKTAFMIPVIYETVLPYRAILVIPKCFVVEEAV